MEKAEFIDKLKRAYEMEEVMSGKLIDLCEPEALPDELPVKTREIIKNIITGIKDDTLRHKRIVSEIKDSLKYNG